MAKIESLRVWLIPGGPNPWKVVQLLEELSVPYEIETVKYEQIKSPIFTNTNANGRSLAIEDPNTDITLWESAAIVHYLITQYDTKNLLHYNTLKEQSLCNQWAAFQISGQGPYFGQLDWFIHLHAENLPSAIERYANGTRRILGVLEGVLASSPGKEKYLVGDRITFADLSFVPWNDRLDSILGIPVESRFEGFPHVQKWHESMTKRPSWVKAMETRARLMEKQSRG